MLLHLRLVWLASLTASLWFVWRQRTVETCAQKYICIDLRVRIQSSLWANTLARSCHQSASGRLPLLAQYRDVSKQLAIQRSMMDLGIIACLMFDFNHVLSQSTFSILVTSLIVDRVIVARYTQVARVQFSFLNGFLNAPDIGPNRERLGEGDSDDDESIERTAVIWFTVSSRGGSNSATIESMTAK
jgi:hypothetical protein